ncbi:unnamed protein product [Didymodactylos carnosus]|uniref:DEP domain-containing protein n=1 Tax=Didymodactylos carnosus TaxID=1234261 RepID=A0A8S2IKK3_9BILA|nr:unnamed protein product [Didymodactylos carnosus]CAF3762452.1 unnamed protein product [Didymodactylos carnosus]
MLCNNNKNNYRNRFVHYLLVALSRPDTIPPPSPPPPTTTTIEYTDKQQQHLMCNSDYNTQIPLPTPLPSSLSSSTSIINNNENSEEHTLNMSPNGTANGNCLLHTTTTTNHLVNSSNTAQRLFHRNKDDYVKDSVDLYTAALHLRQRLKEEDVIKKTYQAYLDPEKKTPDARIYNCFQAKEAVDWLIKKQLCRNIQDGTEIYQILQDLKIIHHVFDLTEFEYPSTDNTNEAKYLFRFRLDDGTADHNHSFQQFASIYEIYLCLFKLEKSRCRGVDMLQQQNYDSNGISLKGDNLARMISFCVSGNMETVDRVADDMLFYGLIKFENSESDSGSVSNLSPSSTASSSPSSVNGCSSTCFCSSIIPKFRNDPHFYYTVNTQYRLCSKKRLDLVALMNGTPALLSSSPGSNGFCDSPFISLSCPDRFNRLCSTNNRSNRTYSNYHRSTTLNNPLFVNCYSCHLHNNELKHSAAKASPTNNRQNSTTFQRRHTSGPSIDTCDIIDQRCMSPSQQPQTITDNERSNSPLTSPSSIFDTNCTCTSSLTFNLNGSSTHYYAMSRRKASASLNSPCSMEIRPTAEELEKLQPPYTWRSYSLKRDRCGYGLILHGNGPCYVERLDPYGSAYSSGIKVNEYIYAVEGVNVLRRSGKEVERLLSMFDKCTLYTVYNKTLSTTVEIPTSSISKLTGESASLLTLDTPSKITVSSNNSIIE